MPAVLGAVLAGLAVALGAFGAHGLKDILSPAEMATYKTAVLYQFFHSLGMILTRILPKTNTPGWLFFAGILVFSGSLFMIVFTGIKEFGMITPLGGLLFMTGWFLFGYQLWKDRTHASED